MIKARALVLAFAAFLALFAVPANAHLLPRQNATLHVVGDKGYLVIAVPASALAGADENRDGLLSPGEIDRHRAAISARVRAGFTVSTGGQTLPFAFLWLADPDGGTGNGTGSSSGAPYLIAMAGVPLAARAGPLTVRTDLFGTRAGEGQMTLRAHRGDDVEIAQLTPMHAAGTVFQGTAGLFAAMAGTGMTHILGGADHLLFLLTLVIAGVTWRQLAAQVTAFTLAHSATLTLTLLGLVHADPAWVEPGIALSIVLVALLNLAGSVHGAATRVCVVFACGLLHGLGFASALDGIAGESSQRLPMLAGFNLGIEAGQVVFLAALLAAGWALHRVLVRAGATLPALGPRLASATAMGFGLLMIAGRTVPAMAGLGL
ncbi:HupE/UreJ family protein [Novosphingobium album (ex Hu et al. 2023)]|uniref:HupE/UreJ family protein n=1 Tax=Novosphingobium album (ex Hu et al. 2023) TaxID=2930093 RepID=A0ABT0B3F1_9SPHN|nr:HupE/UreJ family protein [Novosphingobium album (ex Hu et al. 2023)]MCJ2179567.1 HupE/UreJ family protein [Novosphingobium album (ex Hu et al. 2023)]